MLIHHMFESLVSDHGNIISLINYVQWDRLNNPDLVNISFIHYKIGLCLDDVRHLSRKPWTGIDSRVLSELCTVHHSKFISLQQQFTVQCVLAFKSMQMAGGGFIINIPDLPVTNLRYFADVDSIRYYLTYKCDRVGDEVAKISLSIAELNQMFLDENSFAYAVRNTLRVGYYHDISLIQYREHLGKVWSAWHL